MEKVFVYGSLMQGMRLHGYLEKSKFLGNGEIRGKLFPNPFLQTLAPIVILDSSWGNVVQGEVYEVSQKTLKLLDRVEGHPYLYKRVQEESKLWEASLQGYSVLRDTWIYTWPTECVESGNWRTYLETQEVVKWGQE